MFRSSFPRSEHITALRQKLQERLGRVPQTIEVADLGLNHYKCHYKVGLRRRAEEPWIELAVHFQVMDRLEATGNDAELNRILDRFLNQHFTNNER